MSIDEIQPHPRADVSLYSLDEKRGTLRIRHAPSAAEWDTIVAVMAEKKVSGLNAGGQMTDGAIERIVELDHVIRLDLGGSKPLTDAGLRHLARLLRLQHLDATGCRITDRGLDVLRDCPSCAGSNSVTTAASRMRGRRTWRLARSWST